LVSGKPGAVQISIPDNELHQVREVRDQGYQISAQGEQSSDHHIVDEPEWGPYEKKAFHPRSRGLEPCEAAQRTARERQS
jgi:hypothetical protein